jgi:hypothetical protein
MGAQAIRQGASGLDAETRDVFFIKGDPCIRRIFQYDATGRVTGFPFA